MSDRTRYDLSGSFFLALSPADAFPLFTARGEMAWVPGWAPEFVHPADGRLELDQVFVTSVGGEETLWSVVDLDVDARAVDYLRVTPDSRIARVSVRVSEEDDGSRVDVRYRCTGLNEAGRRELASFARNFDSMMEEWRRLVVESGAGGDEPGRAQSPST